MTQASPKLLLLKGEPKTLQIETIKKAASRGWSVKFKTGGKTFTYGYDNVRWLKDAKWMQPEMCRVYRRGKLQLCIAELWKFEDGEKVYWRVKYKSGAEAEYTDEQITVVTNCLGEAAAKDVYAYMRSVAGINELGATEDEDGILSKIYERLPFVDDKTAAACYLNPSLHQPKALRHRDLIYPFGCNASQKKAVARAFEHQVSVVQGPPGTGKTQTILNIIANIVRQGKTVMVVSNNNSATQNVQEKLEKYGVSFIVAPLGSHDNKERFIANQPSVPKELKTWDIPLKERTSLKSRLHETLDQLSKVYELQNRLAELRQELQAVELEWKHFCKEQNISDDDVVFRKANSANVIWLWLRLQSKAEAADTVKTSLLQRLKLWWLKMWCRYKWHIQSSFDATDQRALITELQTLYYVNRRRELNEEIAAKKKQLQAYDAQVLTDTLTKCSWQLFKTALHDKYKEGREGFSNLKDMYRQGAAFLQQYPVVLSTTFSARNCVMDDHPYDYLIMDEASQVSVDTGTLALACAYNAVIVGDTLQLPNVVTKEDKAKMALIKEPYQIADSYDAATNSFLQSVCGTLKGVPQTLLREHYRCHPRIINFCNQRFYGGNLLIMTKDSGEEDVLFAIRTKPGNHATNHFNQREIDVVRKEVLPELQDFGDIGIVTPYNHQVDAFRHELPAICVGTIHKYQGRENDAIIMSVVDNQITAFADDPNLLNVAVSRAKSKFCLVVSGNKQERRGNIQSLLDYIAYNNCSVTDSKIASIFDYLYVQYTEQRMAFAKAHPHISEYASENLTYAMLNKVLVSYGEFSHYHIVCHMPLRMLIQDTSLMTEEEMQYAGNYSTHLDFLIVDSVSHKPVLAIETDGFSFHNSTTLQHHRDELKDSILSKYELPLLRLSTKGSGEEERVRAELENLSTP